MSDDLIRTHWDAIVIGTGIGGGTVGRALAEQGMKVLFVEKGPTGYRTEAQGLDPEMFDPVARQLRGYWPTPLDTKVDGREASFFAPLGAGVGGSSVFYAATLERPERHDLEDMDGRAHPTCGWPIGFDAMRDWYDRAAAQYHLSGEPDPLSDEPSVALKTPTPLPTGDAAMMAAFKDSGLHPYRLHSAVRNVDGCQSCLGRKCPKSCKMDGRSAGIEPALTTGNAALLDHCEVRHLHANAGVITSIEAVRDGAVHQLTADRYILAGGALGSASLMLASTSEVWPDGIANSSGLVGRNLMFHLNEMIAIWPPKDARFDGPSKSISLRDLYHQDGQRFGTVQAMGIDVGYGEIVHFLNGMLARSALGRIKLLRQFTRIPAAIATKLFGEAKMFVGLMEDLPYPENRVVAHPDGPGHLQIEYTFHKELRKRRLAFRRAMARAFKGHRKWQLGVGPELNFGHPCGTVRFGDDPETSVLNRDCRSHDIENLYVVDASFMPTSLGVNPSLTIAANALRVADVIAKEHSA